VSHRTTVQARQQMLVAEMSQHITTLVQHLVARLTAEPPTLASLEHQVVALGKNLLANLLTSLVPFLLPVYDAADLACSCGARARYQREREATVISLLGPLSFSRPYYHCAACGHGFAPLDQQLQFCAGSVSASLEELLALLGAQVDSFEAAVGVLEKLTLLHVAPNTVRAATERLGQVVAMLEQHELDEALGELPPAPLPGQSDVRQAGSATYISMDGMQVHFDDGWHETKLGALYTTEMRPNPKHPERSEPHAVDLSYVADVVCAEAFGPLVWREAVRRSVTAQSPLVVIGDGAAWIWNIADTYFPGAVQIVDWYHASQYVWQAAAAIKGDATPAAAAWVKQQLDLLWSDRVAEVVEQLEQHLGKGEAVEKAHTYLTNNLKRMQYATYRAKGLQIGSGSIESGCKHVLGARLKQAGMMWSRDGAQAVAKVRARLKSGRWDETIAQRPPLQRRYVRRALAA
jgi:hypothetical protein